MNRVLVDKLARALLYEGYILYPYRPSVKSHQRWTFGGIYPRAWSDAQSGTDAWTMQTECLIEGGARAATQVNIRFLQLIDRTLGKFARPLSEMPAHPEFETVGRLEVGTQHYYPWQEAIERDVDLVEFGIGDLLCQPQSRKFNFPHRRWLEPLREPGGAIGAMLIREQQRLEGEVECSATRIANDLFKLTIRVLNRTDLDDPERSDRDAALMKTLVSTHTILGVSSGEFVSLTDPPEQWREAAAVCRNIGTWPILVGDEPARDTILSSPIILYDYPKIAPESPGDLFDATEIDEILTLRIMTLTDEEKQTAAGMDDRVRDLLARTESLAREQLSSLHGTMRGLASVSREKSHG